MHVISTVHIQLSILNESPKVRDSCGMSSVDSSNNNNRAPCGCEVCKHKLARDCIVAKCRCCELEDINEMLNS